jgi:hypothetical protein
VRRRFSSKRVLVLDIVFVAGILALVAVVALVGKAVERL